MCIAWKIKWIVRCNIFIINITYFEITTILLLNLYHKFHPRLIKRCRFWEVTLKIRHEFLFFTWSNGWMILWHTYTQTARTNTHLKLLMQQWLYRFLIYPLHLRRLLLLHRQDPYRQSLCSHNLNMASAHLHFAMDDIKSEMFCFSVSYVIRLQISPYLNAMKRVVLKDQEYLCCLYNPS